MGRLGEGAPPNPRCRAPFPPRHCPAGERALKTNWRDAQSGLRKGTAPGSDAPMRSAEPFPLRDNAAGERARGSADWGGVPSTVSHDLV